MPRYDFKCRECFCVFEAIVPVNIVTRPCVSCNSANPLLTTFGQAIADRQLCAPKVIQVH